MAVIIYVCAIWNQIKHEKWSQYFHYSSPPPPRITQALFSLGEAEGPPLGLGDT